MLRKWCAEHESWSAERGTSWLRNRARAEELGWFGYSRLVEGAIRCLVQQALPESVFHELGTAVDPQFFHDAGSMTFHRAHTDHQACANKGVGVGYRDQAQSLALALCQLAVGVTLLTLLDALEVILKKPGGHGRAQKRATSGHMPNRIQHFIVCGFLDDIPRTAGLNGPEKILVILVHGQHQNAR